MNQNTIQRTHVVRGYSTMTTILAFALLLFLSLESLAQKPVTEYHGKEAEAILPGADFVKQNSENDFPTFVRLSAGNEIPVEDFFNWLQSSQRTFDQPEFQFVDKTTDELGYEHHRYVQSYRNIPVDQTHFTLHAQAGKVFAFNGKTKTLVLPQTRPLLSEAQALQAALQFVGAVEYKWENPVWEADLKARKNDPAITHFPKGKLVISTMRNQMDGSRLAYVFDISSLDPMKEIRVCVDAMNGSILYDVPMESNCEAASVNTIFNGNRSISTELYTDDDFRLRDDCSAAVIHVRDWNSADLTANPTEIDNTTNTWTTMNEIFGGTTLWCTKQSYNYFLNRFGRNSYDNANGDVSALINALFNCAPPAGCITANNASMSFTGGNMRVGLSSAGVLTNSYATIDIIGHEYAHAVTGATAMLVYEEEWGALNESFSDIFGETIEFFTFGSNDWLIGSERDNGAIRSMSNPNAGNDPDTYLGTNWVTINPPCDGSNDQCGVHTNSGVQNFWFYLLTVGGTGTNDNGDDYDVTGIGITAAEGIAYRNLVVYLGPNSDYADARTGSIQAALDLFGACSPQVASVMDAWYAVGVGAPFLNVTATVTSDYNGADVSCFGANDGEATAVGAEGVPPYTYSWSNGQNSAVATNLSAGSYTVTVTDASGCTATNSVTLTNPPLLSATVGINSDYNGWPISCFGACDGVVEALPVGGVSPYTYQWSESTLDQTTKIASDLCAGTHLVLVTDANGCNTIAEVTLTEPPPLEIEAGPNQTIFYWDLSMACTDLMASGATGGVPPYTYSWSSGGTEAGESVCMEMREDTITIVTYYVTLTDANGCTAVDSLDVCYVDINCGKAGPVKVSICHYPPENPANPQTLCVSLSSLLEHLSHGDALASCEFVSPCGEEALPRINLPDLVWANEGDMEHRPILDVFPNPFADQTTIRFMLHHDETADISLFDMQGKLVRQVYDGKVKGGEMQTVELQQEQLPAGLYLIRLISPGLPEVYNRQLMIK